MKTDRELVMLSIEHWRDMVEGCKWLLENGYDDDTLARWDLYFNEGPFSDDCPLCKKYYKIETKKSGCDMSAFISPWQKTMIIYDPPRVKHFFYCYSNFIENAESIMIPALYECLKYCKKEGEEKDGN